MLEVEGPGEITVTLPIYRVWTVLRDWFGLSTPLIVVRTEFGEEVAVTLTSMVRLTLPDGPDRIEIVLPRLGVRVYELEVTIPRELEAGAITVLMPIGTISAAVITGAALLTAMGLGPQVFPQASGISEILLRFPFINAYLLDDYKL